MNPEPSHPGHRTLSRRMFLVAAAGAATAAACGGPSTAQQAAEGTTVVAADVASDGASNTATTVPTAAATATPTPRPAGNEVRTLLPGTRAETALQIRHSGRPGPVAFVLGGVHGNEPGGWGAADYAADNWGPTAGSLLVLPRANVLAIASFVRTFDDIGDLNRLYPGNAASPLLMEQMAAEIIALCREFEVGLLLDMHESWGFYRDYPGTGTSALGQTVTSGV